MANNKAVTATPSSGPTKGSMTAENTNLHKLMKMGQHPKFEVSGGKKTPA
jgi:hypothetical protein